MRSIRKGLCSCPPIIFLDHTNVAFWQALFGRRSWAVLAPGHAFWKVEAFHERVSQLAHRSRSESPPTFVRLHRCAYAHHIMALRVTNIDLCVYGSWYHFLERFAFFMFVVEGIWSESYFYRNFMDFEEVLTGQHDDCQNFALPVTLLAYSSFTPHVSAQSLFWFVFWTFRVCRFHSRKIFIFHCTSMNLAYLPSSPSLLISFAFSALTFREAKLIHAISTSRLAFQWLFTRMSRSVLSLWR
jgi:hypothetical protein